MNEKLRNIIAQNDFQTMEANILKEIIVYLQY